MLNNFIVIKVKNNDLDKIKGKLKYLHNMSMITIDNPYNSFDEFIKMTIKNANIDELTQAYSKSYFLRFIKNNKFQDGTLCMVDVDNFKLINEKYGHIRADYLLKNLSNFLKKNIRKGDFLFRFGGDEFVIFFDNLHGKRVNKILLRIINNLRLYRRMNKVDISISYGFSRVSKNIPMSRAIEIADTNMRNHKSMKKIHAF